MTISLIRLLATYTLQTARVNDFHRAIFRYL
ncbi:hypothetical protein Halru_1215 [Halovivax ruber XH-70]|uniref:Uncharacterized protein n=1 Tax=Halovivax ruber (strain DSM 18193 / JCM 13892 / XH-70) TaxID=797302 RepID=L0I8D8_HALRX|nr:hypothetical protein Halru_1215 [Halovivax ruber XH-70]